MILSQEYSTNGYKSKDMSIGLKELLKKYPSAAVSKYVSTVDWWCGSYYTDEGLSYCPLCPHETKTYTRRPLKGNQQETVTFTRNVKPCPAIDNKYLKDWEQHKKSDHDKLWTVRVSFAGPYVFDNGSDVYFAVSVRGTDAIGFTKFFHCVPENVVETFEETRQKAWDCYTSLTDSCIDSKDLLAEGFEYSYAASKGYASSSLARPTNRD